MKKILILKQKAIRKLAAKENFDWDGKSFEGLCYIDLFVDDNIKGYVRVATSNNEIIFFNKKILDEHIKKLNEDDVLELIKHRRLIDCYETDYLEYYSELLMPVINKFDSQLDYNDLYINAFDYILEKF